MNARSLDGRAVAGGLRAELAAEAERLIAEGRPPRLATLRFAGDEPGASYAGRLEALCAELGVGYAAVEAAAGADTEEAVAAVERLNRDPEVSGILILLPPPPQVDATRLVEAIDPGKDVDGAHPRNVAALYLGSPGPAPATALAVLELLRAYEIELAGVDAVIVGRSEVVGKPLALLLLRENATVTVCHSRSRDLAAHTARADVLVAAAGRPGLIGPAMVGPGTTVVDVGTNFLDGRMVGDVDPAVGEVAAALSPVPGGVGPLTNLMLVRNLLLLTRSASDPR